MSGSGIILPKGTRYHEKNTFLIENAPTIRTLTLEDYDSRVRTITGYEISIPWEYILFELSENYWGGTIGVPRIFWSKTRVKSLNNKVIGALLPNVSQGGTNDSYYSPIDNSSGVLGAICLGGMPYENGNTNTQIESLVENLYTSHSNKRCNNESVGRR